jgi:hypothetical protein
MKTHTVTGNAQNHKDFDIAKVLCIKMMECRHDTFPLAVLQIQTLLRQIWIMPFTLIRIRNRLAFRFDADPDPYRFKVVMNQKLYFFYIFT